LRYARSSSSRCGSSIILPRLPLGSLGRQAVFVLLALRERSGGLGGGLERCNIDKALIFRL
jgi:hypothetical protein